jgi:hypothetical protein
MDTVAVFPIFSYSIFFGILGLIQLAWHVAVIVFLYRIWQKVKHLPG